ncbi:MAG TPA: methyltransferase domain-containing protein [Pseudonocardia sp.]|uniref:class I SAM-dependent methyltransferase n=1 Tax=Pseudonocardia sp. TaxID=60912 RepID=UPI002EDB50A4
MLIGSGCRFCGSTSGEQVLDLGRQPPSEHFAPLLAPEPDPVFPLRMWWCARCRLAQLADTADVPEEPAGIEPAALAEQRAAAVEWLLEEGLLPATGRVAEFSSPHGGSFAGLLGRCGLSVGPAGERAGETADVVLDGCFGLMHAADQRTALAARVDRLSAGGVLVLQFHSLAAIVRHEQWNALRHGHFAYYSTPALCGLLGQFGLTAIAARRFPLYGGTVCLVASRAPSRAPATPGSIAGLREVLADERSAGVLDVATLRGLRAAAVRSTGQLHDYLTAARAGGTRVSGYGAASRAVALLNLAGLDERLLTGVADASPAKWGRRMPGTRIPVITPAALVEQAPDVVLVLLPELLPEARARLPGIERAGGRWVDVGALGRADRTDDLAPSAWSAS